MKKSSLFSFDVDFSKNSIKSLHSIASNLTKEEYLNAIRALNCVAFERKAMNKKKKRDDDELESLFEDTCSNIFK
jgi:hypothetical protein